MPVMEPVTIVLCRGPFDGEVRVLPFLWDEWRAKQLVVDPLALWRTSDVSEIDGSKPLPTLEHRYLLAYSHGIPSLDDEGRYRYEWVRQ